MSCKVCSPYKCEECALFIVMKKTEEGRRLCSDCNPTSARRSLYDLSRPEMKVNRHLAEEFPGTYPIGTYAPFRDCGDTKRPDTVVIIGNLMAIVETDEGGHRQYEVSCEWAKALQHGQSAIQTEGVRRVCFVRLNPDAWRANGVLKNPPIADRLDDLVNLLRLQATDQEEDFTMFKMFYSNPTGETCVQISKEELTLWFERLSK